MHLRLLALLTISLFSPLLLKGSILKPPKWELGAVAIFQNEGRFIKEWIEFHRLVGVEHFWLYDNNSQDDVKEILKPYIKAGIVELFDWPETSKDIVFWNRIQCVAYMDAIERASGKAEWLAILDVDEFLFSPQNRSVPAILKRYVGLGGVGANWVMFGTSGVERLQKGDLMTELMTHRAPLSDPIHTHVKSIVNPLLVKSINNPHFCRFQKDYTLVTSDGIPFYGPFSPTIEHHLLRINHYWCRDEAFLYEDKIPRRVAWGGTAESILQAAAYFNSEEDTAILPLVEELKKRMTAPN
jgi:hypothetical protein